MIRSINSATSVYELAARKATAEGFPLGGGHWWAALRYHKEFPWAFERENGRTIEEEERRLSAKNSGATP